MAVQLYAVVLAAHLCQVRSGRLRKSCLELEYLPEGLTREQVGQPNIIKELFFAIKYFFRP